MAQVTVVTLVDDLDRSVSADVQTITYFVRGQEYRIDVGAANLERLNAALEVLGEAEEGLREFTAASRSVTKLPPAGAFRRGSARTRTGVEAGKVRTWAIANGIEVSARGRIPAPIIDQFIAAQAAPSTEAAFDPAQRTSDAAESAVAS
jgi:Lsr2